MTPSHAARSPPWSRAELEFAVVEVLRDRADVLYPYGEPSGLTAEERDVLRRGGADLTEHPFGPDDPLLRTTAEHAAILASALTTAEAAARLGVSEMRVRQRLTGRSLLGISTAHGWRIPSFQFSAEGELPGWARVARVIPSGVSPVEALHWLELPHPELVVAGEPVSPRRWLLEGRSPAAVVAAAEDFQNR